MSKDVFVGVNHIVKRDLPEGYTQVEYIESSGTQYIDTGVTPSATDNRVQMDFVTGDTEGSLFGSHNGNTDALTCYWGGFWITGSNPINYTLANGTRYTLDVHAQNNSITATINGETKTGSYSGTMPTTANFALFAQNNISEIKNHCAIKLMRARIYKDNVLTRDFVPCQNASNALGLYDMVGGEFYANAGTGSFTSGEEVLKTLSYARAVKEMYVAVPQIYTKLAYIQSNGTQYINTGVKASPTNLRIVTDYTYPAEHGSASIYGSRNNANASAKYSINAYNQPSFYVGTSSGLLAHSTSLNTDYVLDVKAQNNTLTVKLNDTTRTATYSGTLSDTYPIYLFANNQEGTAAEKASIILRGAKIYNDDVLVRDYVPAKKADGTIGLFDQVQREFYGNAGTGAFAAGANTGQITIYRAHRVVIGYVGDGTGVAREFFHVDGRDTPGYVDYTGNYAISEATIDGAKCKIYTLKSSGTLTIGSDAMAWLCGGGAGGEKSHTENLKSNAGNGGGGGYVASGILTAGTYTVAIGSGGGGDTNGGSTAINGVLTANGGSAQGDGGSGGGGGGISTIDGAASTPGNGAGVSTYPFGLTSLKAHCAGGGGGSSGIETDDAEVCSHWSKGGTGGSNGAGGGSCGAVTTTEINDGSAGGSYGGGKGGWYQEKGGWKNPTAGAFYGAGGGGGAIIRNDTGSAAVSGVNSSSGYQGVVYIAVAEL